MILLLELFELLIILGNLAKAMGELTLWLFEHWPIVVPWLAPLL